MPPRLVLLLFRFFSIKASGRLGPETHEEIAALLLMLHSFLLLLACSWCCWGVAEPKRAPGAAGHSAAAAASVIVRFTLPLPPPGGGDIQQPPLLRLLLLVRDDDDDGPVAELLLAGEERERPMLLMLLLPTFAVASPARTKSRSASEIDGSRLGILSWIGVGSTTTNSNNGCCGCGLARTTSNPLPAHLLAVLLLFRHEQRGRRGHCRRMVRSLVRLASSSLEEERRSCRQSD
jgi:hypothetical protein